MASVERITKLVHPGVLGDFDWPQGIPDFNRYNLIYGWNGTGKTTISRMFRSLESNEALEEGIDLVLRIGGKDWKYSAIPDKLPLIRVFNRDFIEKNVFSADNDEIDPILIIGEQSAQKQKQIDQLERELASKIGKLEKHEESNSRAVKSIDDYRIAKAEAIRSTLRSSGTNPYNSYDKRNFKNRIEKAIDERDWDKYLLDDSDRDKHRSKISESPKPRIPVVEFQLPELESLHETVAKTLEGTVVSQTIESLADDSELTNWVHKGFTLHSDRDAEQCLFCNQPLPTDRLRRLETHFNDQYVQFLKDVDANLTLLEATKNVLNSVELPEETRLHEWLASSYLEEKSRVLDLRETVITYLDALIEELNRKRNSPFKSRALELSVPAEGFNLVDKLNEIISQHNGESDSYSSQISASRLSLENDIVAASIDKYLRLNQELEHINTALDETKGRIDEIHRKIARLESDILEHRRPADELNVDLHRYLGHDDIRLKVKDHGYELCRGDSIASSLSEGERTAIALLYFLKTLEGRSVELSKSIIVIDDPVSSLDMNSLYSAFGYIRDRTQGAGQLFILTHNFSFFRQVRNWFHHVKGQKKKRLEDRPCRFYMLAWDSNGNKRKSSLQALDPLLEQYNSDYHYLFAKIYRAAYNDNGGRSLEDNYMFPNIARRLLEMFLAFRQPNLSGDLSTKFSRIDFDEAKKIRILRFLHANSHGDAIGTEEHDPSALAEGSSVLEDVVDLIKWEDSKHFAAMEELVKLGDGDGASS